MHTTNYTNALILPAEDCKTDVAIIPEKPDSVAGQLFALLHGSPYKFDSDHVISTVQAMRKGIDATEHASFRKAFFSKGQACFRASPLVKTHGWAVHHNDQSKVALIDPATPEFHALSNDIAIQKIHAMRNKRK